MFPELNSANYAPRRVYDSPFLRSDYDSGVVTIQQGERVRGLDFQRMRAIDRAK